jgi:hypothetical protein
MPLLPLVSVGAAAWRGVSAWAGAKKQGPQPSHARRNDDARQSGVAQPAT